MDIFFVLYVFCDMKYLLLKEAKLVASHSTAAARVSGILSLYRYL